MKILKKLGYFLAFLVAAFVVLSLIPGFQHLPKAVFYNFADIDDYQIFANRTIKAGKHQAWKEAKNYNSTELAPEQITKIESYETIAFLVVQDSAIKYERYWGEYGEASLSNSFSMAKSVVSLLIGAALGEGKIKSLDQKVSDFLPQFKEGMSNQLTLRNLLTMSSGLNWDESYANPLSMTTAAYYGDDLEGLMQEMKVVTTPGEKTVYLSGNTQVLAHVLQVATNKTLPEYATEKLWKPLGAKHDALWSLDAEEGREKAYCCFNSNVRDFARLGQLVLQKGNWKGQQLIPEAYIEEATAPASELKAQWAEGTNDYYGFQFWYLEYKGHKIPYMRGILGQYIFVIPEKNAVVVRLGHKRDKEKGEYYAPKDAFLYLDAALEILE